MHNLVIVESPAKAKTIKKYLGKNYEVMASMGHVRDLPKSTLGVDVDHDFTPKYLNIRKQSETIKGLQAAAKKSDKIYLATEPGPGRGSDQLHLANILKLDTDDANRVTFNEITKSGVKEGMSHPRKLDMDLVNAQQARRILDRIVGYKLSPFLWKKVRPGLSARAGPVGHRADDCRPGERNPGLCLGGSTGRSRRGSPPRPPSPKRALSPSSMGSTAKSWNRWN